MPVATSKPNILITGTPGVGKSTISEKVAQESGLEWINIGKVAEEHNCFEEYDNLYKCPVLDEDKLLDVLDEKVSEGGFIVDYHGCDFFPKRWFDAVFVLRTNTQALYDRLRARDYLGKKLDDNIQCEIFQTILEEAKDSYDEDIVVELQNNTLTDIEANCSTIMSWVQKYRQTHHS